MVDFVKHLIQHVYFPCTYHTERQVFITLCLEFPLAWLYREEKANAVQTLEALHLCQWSLLA